MRQLLTPLRKKCARNSGNVLPATSGYVPTAGTKTKDFAPIALPERQAMWRRHVIRQCGGILTKPLKPRRSGRASLKHVPQYVLNAANPQETVNSATTAALR